MAAGDVLLHVVVGPVFQFCRARARARVRSRVRVTLLLRTVFEDGIAQGQSAACAKGFSLCKLTWWPSASSAAGRTAPAGKVACLETPSSLLLYTRGRLYTTRPRSAGPSDFSFHINNSETWQLGHSAYARVLCCCSHDQVQVLLCAGAIIPHDLPDLG